MSLKENCVIIFLIFLGQLMKETHSKLRISTAAVWVDSVFRMVCPEVATKQTKTRTWLYTLNFHVGFKSAKLPEAYLEPSRKSY